MHLTRPFKASHSPHPERSRVALCLRWVPVDPCEVWVQGSSGVLREGLLQATWKPPVGALPTKSAACLLVCK